MTRSPYGSPRSWAVSGCRTFLAVLLLAVSFAAGAEAATKPDSDAPPGAPESWLPAKPWVLEHWLPYRETRLFRLLGVDRAETLAWLHQDDHTLWTLAEHEGRRPRAVIRRLMAPRRGTVSPRHYRILYGRAVKTFTQRHLMVHMIGHIFHVRTLFRATPEIYGVTTQTLVAQLRRGLTYLDIAERAGRSRRQVDAAALRVLRATMRRAVRHREMPKAQARYWLAQQRALWPRWVNTTLGRAAAASAPAAHAQRWVCELGRSRPAR